MLFQSHHVIFLAMLIAPFTLAKNNTTIQCKGGFAANITVGMCNDRGGEQYLCPTPQCGKDGHLWVPMAGCLYHAILGSGISDQQCTSYNMERKDAFTCINSGDAWYSCPYTPDTVPFITCSNCTLPPKATGGGPIQGTPIVS
ncbi:uncharacterized protein MELLADRAFT_123768 [Melampsora larici-populina 98AG31]|uniref:Secreted protein n=1 Tax=Melampsora larici-populina (strain 98AG31 / pathotype 3-4-7) TaxID=747676 RepID=F4R3V1_MELLP|nr:uncharacterized protein MELLADRAFT_123768 [Melampsora larici-populina 98AG31]EGG13100.1 secreted protein [Melampsora larici-populina 98AG31]